MRVIVHGENEDDGGISTVSTGNPEWSDDGTSICMDVAIKEISTGKDIGVAVVLSRTEILQWAIEAMQGEVDKPALRSVS
jgi:hypothetical protein